MTSDSTDTSTDNEAAGQSVAPAVKPAVVSNPSAAKRPSSGLLLLAILLAILALALAGYQWFSGLEQTRQVQAGAASVVAMTQLVDAQEQQLRTLQREIDQRQLDSSQQLEALNATLASVQDTLVSQQKRLHALSTTDRADWLLAESEYLMRLASQRLLMGEDVAGALALLQSADAILLELNDSALFPVREALAEDMAKLRAAGQRDLEGLYLKIGAAANQGDQLRLFEPPTFKSQAAEPVSVDGWQDNLRSGVAAALEKLKSYIRITHREEAFRPVLAPEHEAAVRQNLRLSFEQAQMAALAANQSLYEASLEKARYWLTTFYTLDLQASNALLMTVDQLQQQRVDIEVPDISGSARALKHYLNTVHDVASPASPAANEESAAKADEEDTSATQEAAP